MTRSGRRHVETGPALEGGAAGRRVEESRELAVPAATAFTWVADLRTHPLWIPLTRAELDRPGRGATPPGRSRDDAPDTHGPGRPGHVGPGHVGPGHVGPGHVGPGHVGHSHGDDTHPGDPTAVGQELTMVSGPWALRGAPGFVDRMRIVERVLPHDDAPGRSRVRKLGPVLLGDAGFEVRPLGPERCRVVWWEAAHLAGPWPRTWTARPVGALLRPMMRVGLARLARLLESAAVPGLTGQLRWSSSPSWSASADVSAPAGVGASDDADGPPDVSGPASTR